METKKVSPMEGALSFLASGMRGPHDQITTKVSGTMTVDSALPADTNIWETGINRNEIEGKRVIVEQYEDKKRAEAGHKRWSELMEEYPDYPLKDIDMWSLDSLK